MPRMTVSPLVRNFLEKRSDTLSLAASDLLSSEYNSHIHAMISEQTDGKERVGETMVVGRLASGQEVFVPQDSHFFTHPDTHPVIKDALAKLSESDMHIDATGIARPEAVMEGQEQLTICVPVTGADTFVYAKRAPRPWHTRFVTQRFPAPTNIMSLVLRRHAEENRYELITAFWGPQAPREPADTSLPEGSPELAEATAFWATHALVLPEDDEGKRKLGVDPQSIRSELSPGEK